MDETQLILTMLFGGIGLGFFIYGKNQRAIVPLSVGIALFIFPYFVTELYVLFLVGALLVVLPYFIRL